MAFGFHWKPQWHLDLSGVGISVDTPTWIWMDLSGILISVAFGSHWTPMAVGSQWSLDLRAFSHLDLHGSQRHLYLSGIWIESVGILSESGIAVNLRLWGSCMVCPICDSVGMLSESGIYQLLSTVSLCVGHGNTESATISVNLRLSWDLIWITNHFRQSATQLGSYLNQAWHVSAHGHVFSSHSVVGILSE